MATAKNNPSDFLKTVLGRPVVVKLNSGVDYRGVQNPNDARETCAAHLVHICACATRSACVP